MLKNEPALCLTPKEAEPDYDVLETQYLDDRDDGAFRRVLGAAFIQGQRAAFSAARAEVEGLRQALRALTRDRCPACPGSETVGHDERCWLGVLLAAVPGPAYEAARLALSLSRSPGAEGTPAAPTPNEEERHA